MNRFFTLLLAASCLTAVGQVPDYVPTDGLVAWYPFNGNAADESGNGNDGVISGAILTSNRFDELNSSFYFNGSAYIEIAHSESINIPTGQDLSWSVWLLSEPHGSSGGAFEKWNNNSVTSSYTQLMLRRNADGDYFVSNGYCANPEQAGTGQVTTELSANVWNHLALVTENLETQLFLNGELISSGIVEDIGCSNTNVLHIGRRPSATNRYFKGKIDDFAIWNRALNPDEVVSLYSSMPTIGCTEESACNFNPEATSDDGTCEAPGCTDPQACNFILDAACDDGSCDYSCCPGPGCCDSGMFWDWELGMCQIANPSDSNFDGCVQLNDLLDLLSAYGDCGAEESPWQCGDPVSYQGYDYATVLIDDQCWFAENLRNENYGNGDAIPSNLSDNEWQTTSLGAVAVYGEGSSQCNIYTPDGDACDEAWSLIEYGRLYNWYAVADSRSLCPSGWHVPTDQEWNVVSDVLGGQNVAGGKMKTTYGWNGGEGTNLSGFSGLPGGVRSDFSGSFCCAGYDGSWWSSTQSDSGALDRSLFDDGGDVLFPDDSNQRYGYSIRCIKDAD